ncbi:hypothetical protein Tco_1176525 [Tanacetum coccineum]
MIQPEPEGSTQGYPLDSVESGKVPTEMELVLEQTQQAPQEKSMAKLLLEVKLPQALQALCEKLNKYVQENEGRKNMAEEQAG